MNLHLIQAVINLKKTNLKKNKIKLCSAKCSPDKLIQQKPFKLRYISNYKQLLNGNITQNIMWSMKAFSVGDNHWHIVIINLTLQPINID